MSRLAKQLGLPSLPRQLSPTRRYQLLEFPYRAAKPPQSIAGSAQPDKFGANYQTTWARRYPARLTRVALIDGPMRLMVRVLASPICCGQDRLASLRGPAIFAANHHSHLDTPLLLTSIPQPWGQRLVVGAAADYFFTSKTSSALSALLFGAIPIERSRINRRSADQASELVANGWSLLLFPEGGRSPDGWGQPFRGGAAYLAHKTGRPVVPIHIAGSGKILRKGKWLPQPSTTSVNFGRPMWHNSQETTARFAARIETEVAALADEAATDWYQARLRASANKTPSLTGPSTGVWRRNWALSERHHPHRRRWPKI